ncbi:DUF2842 domain-containing protein [Sphingomonas bacterium]|uniref:DUF2842 domain-containing protein n=1 Tax=Sphingomonas bacterium TaxID=1895847 RepID=UPI00157680ED|nr:DUF2842 domain-containing protein [Sphingomonas bacterium]
MTPSWRKPAGVFIILGLIAVWAIAIASLSGTVGTWWWPAQTLFYLVTGIIWIAPLRPLLVWMESGNAGDGDAR